MIDDTSDHLISSGDVQEPDFNNMSIKILKKIATQL